MPSVKRVGSFKASNSRAGYGPLIVKISGKYELHFIYKSGRQEFELFKNQHSKTIWGRIVSVEVVSLRSQHSKELCDYLRVANERGEQLDFKVNGFDQMLAGVNDFSQLFTEIRTSKSMNLLAIYLILLNTSLGFVCHNSNVHDQNGMMNQ